MNERANMIFILIVLGIVVLLFLVRNCIEMEEMKKIKEEIRRLKEE